MKKKSTPATSRRVSKPQPAAEIVHTAPIEHYRGERTNEKTGELGDLEEETLDPAAPFNKTYGRQEEGQ